MGWAPAKKHAVPGTRFTILLIFLYIDLKAILFSEYDKRDAMNRDKGAVNEKIRSV